MLNTGTYLYRRIKYYVQDSTVMKKDNDNRSYKFWKFRVKINSDLPSAKRNAFWVNVGL